MSAANSPSFRLIFAPLVIVAAFLLLGSYLSWPPALPLLVGTLVTAIISWRQRTLLGLWQGLRHGVRSTVPVLIIMCLVGALTGLWMGVGTTGAMVAIGLQFARPDWYILTCFVAAATVAMLLGSAVGTLSTIGLALIGIASSLNQPIGLVAGALVSGALLGDRAAIVSSNFHLAVSQAGAYVTTTWRLAWRRFVPTAIVCLLVYGFAGRIAAGPTTPDAIPFATTHAAASIAWMKLVPPALVIVLAALRVPVRLALTGGLIAAVGQALLGGSKLPELLTWTWSGASDITPFGQQLHGGGIAAMLPIVGIIVTAAAFAGSYEGSGLLAGLVTPLVRSIRHPAALSRKITVVSLATAAVACNQTLSVLLPARMFRHEAVRWDVPPAHVAVTLLDSGGIFAALVPWNQFAIICAAVIGLSPLDYVPYAFLPWLLLATSLLAPLGSSPQRSQGASASPVASEQA